jgi:hypothetical protein
VNNVWERKQVENLEACVGTNVCVGGDARCCSPGHTAKYGSYTLMDLETGMILATELVQVNKNLSLCFVHFSNRKNSPTIILVLPLFTFITIISI